jgi:hypothetical protein
VTSIFAPSPPKGGVGVSNDIFTCARAECDIVSTRKKHNQKYCSDECCRIATNQRIMERYYDRKAQQAGSERYCIKCEKTRLSRYNNSETCAACDGLKQKQINDSFVEMLNNIDFVI